MTNDGEPVEQYSGPLTYYVTDSSDTGAAAGPLYVTKRPLEDSSYEFGFAEVWYQIQGCCSKTSISRQFCEVPAQLPFTESLLTIAIRHCQTEQQASAFRLNLLIKKVCSLKISSGYSVCTGKVQLHKRMVMTLFLPQSAFLVMQFVPQTVGESGYFSGSKSHLVSRQIIDLTAKTYDCFGLWSIFLRRESSPVICLVEPSLTVVLDRCLLMRKSVSHLKLSYCLQVSQELAYTTLPLQQSHRQPLADKSFILGSINVVA